MENKMNKNNIIEILEDWNFWKREIEIGQPRRFYLDKLNALLNDRQVVVITGPRRAGKSYIMRQLARDLLGKDFKSNEILMINFEDPRFTELNVALLESVYETYLEFLSPQGRPVIFLDEVQEVEGWEKWVRMMHELNKARIVISGSNSRLLSRELATLLTGRHLDLTVFPLSFTEYLSFNRIDGKNELEMVNKQQEAGRLFREYLEFGSFPEVVLARQKKEILLNYFEDIINRDLIRRFKIRKTEKLKSLAKYYLANISTLTTFSSMEKHLQISADTIEKFSGYFEQNYLLFFLKRFSYKVREQDKSPRKVYAVDGGMANVIGFRFSQNLGRLAENLVFLKLKREQTLNSDMELYYWKDQYHHEVDFVIKEHTQVVRLIQVCWQLSEPKTRDREIRNLLKAMDEFNLGEGEIITEDYERMEEIRGKTIKFTSLHKWLLG